MTHLPLSRFNRRSLLTVQAFIASKKHCRFLTNAQVREKRCKLFDEEKSRQLNLVRRVEKIQVEHKGVPDDCTLIMNRGLSTPYNCAMHIQEILSSRSVLALVNGEAWDMHRPLVEDCELKFVHFKDDNPYFANLAYWRSCSFLLGHIAETSFKEEYYVELCGFPSPDVKSGRFVHDVDLKIENWEPSEEELRTLSRGISRLAMEEARFLRLEIDASLAARMFEDNSYKTSQIPAIAAKSKTGNTVTVYRVADHVDISRGPLISNTAMIGQFALSSVHKMSFDGGRPFYRLQGVSLPKQTWAHYWTFDMLRKRAAKLSNLPVVHQTTSSDRPISAEM